MSATVREATADDADAVERLLDAAMLEFERAEVRERIACGNALVAVVGDDGAEDERLVGVCVFAEVDSDVAGVGDVASLDGANGQVTEVEHIAVHRSRRGRGIGRDLVVAVDEWTDGSLIVRFREQVRPFYEALGFEVRGGDDSDGEDDGKEAWEKRLLGVRT